eukprot:CAMPEP_0169128728 /NCGR_PEP_ID=MMETSP1015-20121227/36736_1 /TAXON_ID=342587 /ORGANISM="Karlodinium micrum, Strain CCMP2283" /LENGTH=54 /DNA_ID=CAMNT_0009192677 /DNA_START=144 /DNA_END=305 /DNA_ORIENTATION=+
MTGKSCSVAKTHRHVLKRMQEEAGSAAKPEEAKDDEKNTVLQAIDAFGDDWKVW